MKIGASGPKKALLTAMAFWVLSLGGPSAGTELAVLRGLDTVFVVVEDLPPRAVELGLSADEIKDQTAACLKQAGLSVPTFSYEDGYLYIRVPVVMEAFSVEVSLREAVSLKRAGRKAVRAATWMKSVTGVHRDDGRVIKAALQEIIDGFIAGYRASTPAGKKPDRRTSLSPN